MAQALQSVLLLFFAITSEVSSQTCPNRILNIPCHITTASVVTIWNIPQGNCPSNVIILSQSMGTDCGIKNESCGPFIGTNVAPPPGMDCTTSVLMVVATPQLNGANVSCYSGGVLQYQYNISIEIPPHLPVVITNATRSGLTVSCTPNINGGLPTSYNVSIEPDRAYIFNASNGTIKQEILELLPNTTYIVRVVAINCAGHSGEVIANVTTGLGPSYSPLFSWSLIIGVAVGVGLPLVMGIVLSIFTITIAFWCYYRKREVNISSISDCIDNLNKTQYIEHGDNRVLEVQDGNCVILKDRNDPPTLNQLWYLKCSEDKIHFKIISMSNRRVGLGTKTAQSKGQEIPVVLCDDADSDLWIYHESHQIMSSTCSKYFSLVDNRLFICESSNESFHLEPMRPEKQQMFYIKHQQSSNVITIDPTQSHLVCSQHKDGYNEDQLWHKLYSNSANGTFFIFSTMNRKNAISHGKRTSCTSTFLWKEEDGHILSEDGFLMGYHEGSIILHNKSNAQRLQNVFKFEAYCTSYN